MYDRKKKSLDQNEEKYRLIFEHSPFGIFYFNNQGMLTTCNNAFVKMLGIHRQDLEGRELLKINNKRIISAIQKTLRGEATTREGELPSYQTGKMIIGKTLFTPVFSRDGDIIGGIGIIEDVTESRYAEKELLNAYRKQEEIIEFLPDPTFVVNLEGKVLAWNKAMEEMTGIPKSRMIGKGDYEYALPFYGYRRPILIDLVMLPENELKTYKKYYDQIKRSGNTFYSEAYVSGTYDGKGAYLWASASVLHDTEGNAIGAIETIRDFTERKHFEEQLKYFSMHDQLTGLYNRFYFEDAMGRMFIDGKYPISIISADIDNLKLINDTMGHDKGDQVIITAAGILKKSIRKSDILARMGGDEYIVLLPRTNEETGKKIVKRIKKNLEIYNRKPGISLSISLGLATAQDHQISYKELYKKADDLMYRDKKSVLTKET